MMTLSKRIIPCLDIDGGRVVKGINFRDLRDAGDPVELAIRYRDAGADELVFLDVSATNEKRKIALSVVKNVGKVIDIPFAAGGGIKSIRDARLVLTNGADKIAINSAAVQKPDFITNLSHAFGRQCVVVAIDAKRWNPQARGAFQVYINGGRIAMGIDAKEWAKRAEALGAGEILLTSMDRDGTKKGYDITMTREICSAVSIPVIASGGAGSPEDFVEVFEQTEASAALAASIFHYSSHPVPVVKSYLATRGVEVRL
jgi:cyclase